MSRDEIKTMAFQAGFYDGREDLFWVGSDGLARFAALVAAKEREACAQVVEAMAPEFGEKGWAAKDRGDLQLSLGMLGIEFQLKEGAAAIRARGAA